MEKVKIFGVIIATAFVSSTLTYQYSQPFPDTPQSSDASKISEPPIQSKTNNSVGLSDCAPEPIVNSKPTQRSDSQKPSVEQTAQSLKLAGDEHRKPKSQDNSYQKLKQREQQVEKFKETLSSLKNTDPVDFVQERYESEGVDYEWASQKEEDLLSLFEDNDELSSFSPLDLSCKSKNCQVVMAVEDQRQAERIYKSFLQATINNEKGSEQSVSYFSDPRNGKLIMYVSQNGIVDLLEEQ